MVTFGSHVGNHQFQPFLSGVYAGVIFDCFEFKIQHRKRRANSYFPVVDLVARLDPWRWRANHYVSLLGRSVVFRVEACGFNEWK